MPEDTLRISILARIKQGDLRAAQVKRGWTQKKMAKYLGMSQQEYGKLLNLQWFPKKGFTNKQERKFLELTGKMSDELFPEWARHEEFLEAPKVLEVMREATPQMLADNGLLALSPGPDIELEQSELRRIVQESLGTLKSSYRNILQKRFFEDKTLREVAEELGVTSDNIRQKEGRALRDLRHPKIAKYLKPFAR